MTTLRRDGNPSPFEAWTRSEPRLDSISARLSITDCDYWIHQYRAHRDRVNWRIIDSIMLVELKTFSAELPYSQRDTLRLVAEVCRRSCLTNGGRVRTHRITTMNEVRLVRFYGVFLLQLSSDRPDTSDNITWHGKPIDINKLVDVLSFKRNPITMNIRSERRHHLASVRQLQPELDFDLKR